MGLSLSHEYQPNSTSPKTPKGSTRIFKPASMTKIIIMDRKNIRIHFLDDIKPPCNVQGYFADWQKLILCIDKFCGYILLVKEAQEYNSCKRYQHGKPLDKKAAFFKGLAYFNALLL